MKDPRWVTPAEFAIIEILWDHTEDLPVSVVQQKLSPRRNLAYTTVMTLLDKMRRKGSVRRRKQGKAYYYAPKVKRREVLNFLVQEFANSYCHGRLRLLKPFLQSPGIPDSPVLRLTGPDGQNGNLTRDLEVELL